MCCLASIYYLFADCFCKLKIVDESHPKAGIWVNVFAPTMEMLPHVGLAGDIIQLSRVMV